VAELPQPARRRDAGAALALCDREGRLLYASPALGRWLESERPEPLDLIGHLHPDDRAAFEAALDRLARPDAGDLTVDLRLRRADGSWRAIRCMGASLAQLPAPPLLLFSFERVDVRQSDQALIDTRLRLAEIFQQLADGILLQSDSGRVLYANTAAARICGFESSRALIRATPADLAARLELLDEERRPFPASALPGRRVLQGEDVPPLTIGLRNRGSGEERWVTIASTPLDDALTQSRVVMSVLHDITEHRRVEGELRRSVALRDTFLAAASHELRTPLTSLRGYLEVTRRRLQRGAPVETVATGLEVAIRQVGRLTRLVDELLDASRLTRGLFVIEPRPLELLPFVRGVVEADRLAAQTAHEVVIAAEAPEPRVSADPDRLEQVVINLLGNARKYSAPDQPIEVTVANRAGFGVVSVRDRGIGIPEADQAHIFEPFRRASNVDKGLTGVGLGLYVAYEIVRAHGGTLSVRSTPGAGATFTLTVPLAPES
jgi:PAS domain S-box-containing protein